MEERRNAYSRAYRLLCNEHFNRALFSKTRIELFAFVFCCIPNHMVKARLGIAVAKRKYPSAVFRNKIRRVIRESFRKHKNMLHGIDVVVLVKKN